MSQATSKKGKVVALVGKGGTGKTAICGIMAGLLAREGRFQLLVIDADPTLGLRYALGMKVKATVGDLRWEMISEPGAKKRMQQHIRTSVGEIVEPGEGFQFLAMGRSEGAGCYCSINDLLKYGIETLARDFDITLIDGEAGVEQVNRRVMDRVDTLLILSDMSQRGVETAALLKRLAGEGDAVKFNQMGLVLNRVKGELRGWEKIEEQTGLRVLGCIPEDEMVADYDTRGKPVTALPATSPSVLATRNLLQELGLLVPSPV